MLYLMLFVITATSREDMKDTSTFLRVMVVRKGKRLTGFLAFGLARREDARAVVLTRNILWLTFTRWLEFLSEFSYFAVQSIGS